MAYESSETKGGKIPVLGELNWDELPLNAVVTAAEVNQFLAGFREESDRGAVLALAAAFDEVLGRTLRRAIRKTATSDKLVDKLFDVNGSLGTFSARIDMGRCLGLIDDSLHTEIHLIRKLRNEAAHHWSDFRLTEERVKRFIDPIDPPIKVLSANPEINANAALLPIEPIVKLSFMAVHLIMIGTIKGSN